MSFTVWKSWLQLSRAYLLAYLLTLTVGDCCDGDDYSTECGSGGCGYYFGYGYFQLLLILAWALELSLVDEEKDGN